MKSLVTDLCVRPQWPICLDTKYLVEIICLRNTDFIPVFVSSFVDQANNCSRVYRSRHRSQLQIPYPPIVYILVGIG